MGLDTTADDADDASLVLYGNCRTIQLSIGQFDRRDSFLRIRNMTNRKQNKTKRRMEAYVRPGRVSFDERSYKLATLAVESFGRLG